jgi:hypothetical protein
MGMIELGDGKLNQEFPALTLLDFTFSKQSDKPSPQSIGNNSASSNTNRYHQPA